MAQEPANPLLAHRSCPDTAILLRLCAVGFFVNCQPSEPFLTRYLMDDKGLSESQLDNTVWPADTYASLALLLPVGLLAECWSYRGTVLLGLLCRQATRGLLLFGHGIGHMTIMQWTYATAVCVENVAYFSLPYLVLPASQFAAATAAIRGACHLGNALGSGVGQLLVSYGGFPLRTLFYMSWACTTVGLLCFPLLPDDKKSTASEEADRASPEMERGLGTTGGDTTMGKGCLVDGPVVVVRDLAKLYQCAGARHNTFTVARSGRRGTCGGAHKRLPVSPVPGSCQSCCSSLGSRLGAWSAWWAIGTATNQIFSNYYQNVLYAASAHAPGGTVELLMGVAAGLTTIGVISTQPEVGEEEEEEGGGGNALSRSRDNSSNGPAKRSKIRQISCLWRSARSLLVFSSLAWATLVAILCSAFGLFDGVAPSTDSKYPPSLSVACGLCIAISAIYAFQLAYGAIVISSECAAATVIPTSSRTVSSGSHLSQSLDFIFPPGDDDDDNGKDTTETAAINPIAIGSELAAEPLITDAVSRNHSNFITTAAELQDGEGSLSREPSTIADKKVRRHAPFAMVFTVCSLTGLALAALSQGICALLVASKGKGARSLKTRGHFALAAALELFVIPLVLLPHISSSTALSSA